MPGYPCCCQQGQTCQDCSGTTPASIDVGLNDVDTFNGECCEELAATLFTMTPADPVTILNHLAEEVEVCRWESPEFETCEQPMKFVFGVGEFVDADTVVLYLTMLALPGAVVDSVIWTKEVSYPFDCTAEIELDWSNGSGPCRWALGQGSATVNPP